MTEEFAPPEYTKREFAKLVNDASCKKYSFLTINMKVGWELRFRRNLNEFVQLGRLGIEEDPGEESSDDEEECCDEGDEGDEREQLHEDCLEKYGKEDKDKEECLGRWLT